MPLIAPKKSAVSWHKFYFSKNVYSNISTREFLPLRGSGRLNSFGDSLRVADNSGTISNGSSDSDARCGHLSELCSRNLRSVPQQTPQLPFLAHAIWQMPFGFEQALYCFARQTPQYASEISWDGSVELL